MRLTAASTRREFLAATSCFGATLALQRHFRLLPLGQAVAQNPRVAEQPLVDKGFAAVRKVGAGVYATISDISKGLDTVCNGGFVVGLESALLIEGFRTASGAAFQFNALRSISQLPARAAVDTHYHFDHSLGNADYGARGVAVWAHAKVPSLMVQNYASLQGVERGTLVEPYQKRLRDAANDTERQRAQGDLNAFGLLLQSVEAAKIGRAHV